MDYQPVLEEVYHTVQLKELQGKKADYIPELSRVDSDKFGLCLIDLEGNVSGIGNYQEGFSIQSISKVFTLALTMPELKMELWKRVHVEPSGDPFNSMVQLEMEHGIPRNPFINSGALVISDALMSLYQDPKREVMDFIKKITGEPEIHINRNVHASELEHSARNKALANFMQAYDNIHQDINALIDFYTYHCSIEMSCLQLAKSFLFLANNGYDLNSQSQVMDNSYAKRMNALLLTCGFYDEAGDFAFKVGLPGKSGVGGGIVAVLPGKFSVAVWSPELNQKGNSSRGIAALELLTTKLGISLF